MSRRAAVLEFDAIAIEGGLLPAEWLANVASLEAPHQGATDYGIPRGLNLRDELGRYWRIAEAHWSDFASARAHAKDPLVLTHRFVGQLLRDVFGIADLTWSDQPQAQADRSYPLTAIARGGRLPLVIAPHSQRLDERDRRFGDGGRQRSAFGLLQEWLNATDEALWGIVSNGLTLRLARDNASLTRPAWIEADLERIFTEERFADFSLLWLLAHASRFGAEGHPSQHCPLEAWREASRTQGTRAREQLRNGVQEALAALGQGFLSEAANDELRRKLSSGELTSIGYFQQLLRLVYRLIFLLTIEERGLLHPPSAAPGAVRLYADGYSLRRLRERARRRRAWDRHTDIWEGFKPVLTGLAEGQSLLALPALGGLFAADQCPDLDIAALGNNALLEAVFYLGWMRTDGALSRINWRDMKYEEFGSVYESLLELVPDISSDGRHFAFAGAEQSKGNARKISGSYYTPDALVQELLDSALEPVIAQRLADSADPEQALLSITVCDPACGSGHFLLAAASRLAAHLARHRAQGTPSGEDFRHALRDVIGHCIYGVDLNPMALELARTALWLEAMTPDRPLGFLDHHLRYGDALLGVLDPSIVNSGIPDDAYAALTGDDKAAANDTKKRNKRERESWQRALDTGDLFLDEHLAEDISAVEQLADDDLLGVAAKRKAWQRTQAAAADSRFSRLADLYVGAFLLPKTQESAAHLPTSRHLWAVANNERDDTLLQAEEAARTACREARVLHWWTAFPHITNQGGFAVMLGNPPWERIKLQEEEFFAARNPQVAEAINKAERARRIEWLRQGRLQQTLDGELQNEQPASANEQALHREFEQAKRTAEAASSFVHVDSGRYPLTGVGDVNTYALFAETFVQLVSASGRAGLIVPTGIATDDSTKAFFASISQAGKIISLFDFENSDGVFPGVHRSYKFCLLTIGQAKAAHFICFATKVEHLTDASRAFTLTPAEFALINPNTSTCPVFRSERDAELTKKLYRQAPVLIREKVRSEAGEIAEPEANLWGIRFQTMFHMSSDSGLFLTRPEQSANRALPLYEAKMIHQVDHRWASYVETTGGSDDAGTADVSDAQKANPDFTVRPRYWVEEREVLARIARVPRGVSKSWLALRKATEASEKEEARQALWLALAAWTAGELFRRVVGSLPADGDYNDGQKLRAGQEVERRLNTNYSAYATVLCEAKITRKKAITEFAKWAQQDSDVPLSDDELATLRVLSAKAPSDASDRILCAELDAWMDRRSPRWLMGWRNIARSTDERSFISSVLPRAAVGHSMPLWTTEVAPRQAALLLANLQTLPFDYSVRQKLGGTNMTFGYVKQFPVLPPDRYTAVDIDFIVPRVLELTYTAHDLAAWAADLGYIGAPFPWNPDRRAQLRAELDAHYAKLYGLDEDELRYILDPADVMGEDYPSETFRVLKANELRQHGEYRTRRLVLEAFGRHEVAAPVYSATHGVIRSEAEARYAGLVVALVRGSVGMLERRQLTQALLWLVSPQLAKPRLPIEKAARLDSLLATMPDVTQVNMGARIDELLRALERENAIRMESQGGAFSQGGAVALPSWVNVSHEMVELAELLNHTLQAVAQEQTSDAVSISHESRSA